LGVAPDTNPSAPICSTSIRRSSGNICARSVYLREQHLGFNLYLGLVLKRPGIRKAVFFIVSFIDGIGAGLQRLMAVMICAWRVANWLAFCGCVV